MKRFLIIIAVLAIVVPGALLAQDELTLEGLAEQVAALVERVEAVEAKLAPITTEDGVCVQYANGQVQRETVTKYFDAYEENLETSRLRLVAIQFGTETGLTVYHFEEVFADRSVTETWRGCEFLDVGEWQEEE